jgi:hopanoid-associated phosphorylase
MIVAVTGLGREARILSQPGFTTVVGGGDSYRLRAKIKDALDSGARRIFSFGICGALSPALKVGDCIVATEVVTEEARYATHLPWTKELLANVPTAQSGAIAGSEKIVAHAGEKDRLYRATSAAGVDMESHIAAGMAEEFGLPFAALRVVSDSSRASLPPAAIAGMAPNGEADIPAVLRSLIAHPTQIPALLQTAWDAEKAFRVLLRCRHVLAPSLATVNLGELSLDMG